MPIPGDRVSRRKGRYEFEFTSFFSTLKMRGLSLRDRLFLSGSAFSFIRAFPPFLCRKLDSLVE